MNRGGSTDPGRMPSAPASLRVQLSPAELLSESKTRQPGSVRDMLQRRRAGPPSTSARVPAQQETSRSVHHPASAPLANSSRLLSSSSQAQEGEIPPADARELAASVLRHQQRRRHVLAAQETLILAPSVTVPVLKQALTTFGPASWVQVNHERHLGKLCGYPLCARPPRKLEISQRPRPRPGPHGRMYQSGQHEAFFRISVSKGTVERNTADDPGGKNAFCADGCWARSEWVRRWILSDELRDPVLQATRTNSATPAGISSASKSTSLQAAASADGGSEGRTQAGRFESTWDRSDWRSIELLDDVHPDVSQRLDGADPPPFALAKRSASVATRAPPAQSEPNTATTNLPLPPANDSSVVAHGSVSPSSISPPTQAPTSGSATLPSPPVAAGDPRATCSEKCRAGEAASAVSHPDTHPDARPPTRSRGSDAAFSSPSSLPHAAAMAASANEPLTRQMYTELTPHPLGDLVRQGQVTDTLSLVQGMVIHERPRGGDTPPRARTEQLLPDASRIATRASILSSSSSSSSSSSPSFSSSPPSSSTKQPHPPGAGFRASARAAVGGPSSAAEGRPSERLIVSRPPAGLNDLLGLGDLTVGVGRQVPLQSRQATTAAQARAAASAGRTTSLPTGPQPASRSELMQSQPPAQSQTQTQPRHTSFTAAAKGKEEVVDLASLFDAGLQVREVEQKSGSFNPDASLADIREKWSERNTGHEPSPSSSLALPGDR